MISPQNTHAPDSSRGESCSKAPAISASKWTLIFRLLGLITVADGKVKPENVTAFQDALLELRAVIDPRLVMTRKMTLDWFKLNKDNLVSTIYCLKYDDILRAITAELADFPHTLDVVTCMLNIALSDDEYSHIEKQIIKKTIVYWKIDVPNAANARAQTRKASNLDRSLAYNF